MSAFYTDDMILKRAWTTAGSAAATDSATTLVKSAIGSGTQLVITGYAFGYIGNSASIAKLVTFQSGSTVKKYVVVGVGKELDVQLPMEDWIILADNANATVTLAAGATAAATGVGSIQGFYIGKRT